MRLGDTRAVPAEAPGELHVALEMRVRGIRLWCLVCRVLQPFIGEDRAIRWAEAGFWRLARWRLAGQKTWQRLAPKV